MNRVIIDDITIDSFNTYDDQYMKNIQSLFDQPRRLEKMSWFKKNNIRVTRRNIDQPENHSTRILYYAELTDQQATEFYLRF